MASSGSFDIKFVTKSISRITCSEPAAQYKSLDESLSFELTEVTLLQDGPSARIVPMANLCTKRKIILSVISDSTGVSSGCVSPNQFSYRKQCCIDSSAL